MEAMRQREAERPLQGDIRIDNAYLGGEDCGGKRRRESETRLPLWQRYKMYESHPQRVRFDAVHGFFLCSAYILGHAGTAPQEAT